MGRPMKGKKKNIMTDSARKQLMYVSLKAQLLIVQDIIETLQERKASLETKVQALAEDLKGKGNG